MPFNTSKCSAISFGSNKQHQSNYTLDTFPIQWDESTKYFGIILQHNLSFNKYIDVKIEKVSKILGAIKYIALPCTKTQSPPCIH